MLRTNSFIHVTSVLRMGIFVPLPCPGGYVAKAKGVDSRITPTLASSRERECGASVGLLRSGEWMAKAPARSLFGALVG